MWATRPTTFLPNYSSFVPTSHIMPVAGLCGLLLFLTGCSAALRISHRPVGSTIKPTSVPGVPFYSKRARCRQEVVWFEPIYTITIAALVPDKDGALQSHPRGTIVLSRTSYESQEVTDFMKLLNNRPSDEGTVQRAWQKIVALADPHVLSRDFNSLGSADRILVGRSSAPAVYVDYSEQYYANAKPPLSGSANLDAKVADDGSLSQVSGQVETKTLATILGALPTSSLITGALGLGAKGVAGGGQVEAFTLTVSVSGYRHTLARLVDYPSGPAPCTIANDISLGEATEYKREDISAAASTSEKEKSGGKEKKPTKQEKKP